MLSALGYSVSGIRAAFTALDVSAQNTANINTDGFKKETINYKEGNAGGVVVNIQKSGKPGFTYLKNGKIAEYSNADPVEETVNRIEARTLLSANLAVFKTADEMEKKVIDLFA